MSEHRDNKHNVTKEGDQYKATITQHFDTMEEATSWAEGATPVKDTTDEPAASDMSIEQAEEINSNVIGADGQPVPNPAADDQGSGNTHAPHEMAAK